MIPKELFDKIRRIEITTSRLVTDVFAGQYHSVFKGQGIEFDEVREYQLGDDIRSIDWNVTARTGSPHVKKFVEERELTVMVLVDASRSSQFSTVNKLKSQIAAEIAAVLAFSAIRNHDRVGLIIFTDRIEKFIPPRKGINHVLRVIREVLYFKPQGIQTDIVQALEYLSKVTTRKTISFIISDFFDEKNEGEVLQKRLSITNKRHDVIAITLNDPKEMELASSGIMVLEDAESNDLLYLDSSSPALREEYKMMNLKRLKEREYLFKRTGVDFIDVSTDSSYIDALIKFFLYRRRR